MDLQKLYKILKESTSSYDGTMDEMAQIAGGLDTAIRDVIAQNSTLSDSDLRRAIRRDATVRTELEATGEKLHDNQLNRFIAKVKEGKPTKAPKPQEREWSDVEPDKAEIAQMVRKTMATKRAVSPSHDLSPAQVEDLVATLDAVSDDPRSFQELSVELASDYETTPDAIISIYKFEKGDVEDTEDEEGGPDLPEPADKEDEFATKVKLDIPEVPAAKVEQKVKDKAETLFAIGIKNEADVLRRVRSWIDSRDEEREVDDPRGPHPLAGVSDEVADDAYNAVAAGLKGLQKSGLSRARKAKPGGADYGGDSSGRTDKAPSAEEMGVAFDSFQNFANSIGENLKTYKATVVTRYPQQIRFSEKFINQLAEEFFNHNMISEDQGFIRNLEEKMVKALRMHVYEFARQYKEAQQS